LRSYPRIDLIDQMVLTSIRTHASSIDLNLSGKVRFGVIRGRGQPTSNAAMPAVPPEAEGGSEH